MRLGALIKTGAQSVPYVEFSYGSIRFAKTFATLELQFPSNRLPVVQEGIFAPCRQTMNETPNTGAG
jgi:hypothetical protein